MNLRNFAIMTFKDKPLLCLVREGYFASTAWIESQEAFEKIIGRSFGIITSDDDTEYKGDKSKFRLPINEGEVLTLLSNSCNSFINRVKPLLNENEIMTLNIILEARAENELNSLENQSLEC